MSTSIGGQGGFPRVLHIHGSLAVGDPQAERCVRLIEAFGGRLRHTMIAADGDYGATKGLTKGVPVDRLSSFPTLAGMPLPGRLQRVARAMVDYHLVLTYGRGAVTAALAHTMFGEMLALPPLIHHEDGSDETAAERRGMRSKWPRRVGLGKSAGLVVPTETMEAVALVEWQQPLGRVKLIRDGVDLASLGAPRRTKGIGRLLKRPGEFWVGCFARHEKGENLESLLSELAEVDENWHLVLVGDGPEKGRAEAAISRLAIDHRVHVLPEVLDRVAAIGLFDILAAPGGAEPLPLTVIEAMAAGKAVIGLDPAEAAAILSEDNAALGANALARLASDDMLRAKIGMANREKAAAERSQATMTAAYRRLYASAMKRESI